MQIYYLSDGEMLGFQDLENVEQVLRENMKDASRYELGGYGTINELLNDVVEALDMQGFWHGAIGNYEVVMLAPKVYLEIAKEAMLEGLIEPLE